MSSAGHSVNAEGFVYFSILILGVHDSRSWLMTTKVRRVLNATIEWLCLASGAQSEVRGSLAAVGAVSLINLVSPARNQKRVILDAPPWTTSNSGYPLPVNRCGRESFSHGSVANATEARLQALPSGAMTQQLSSAASTPSCGACAASPIAQHRSIGAVAITSSGLTSLYGVVFELCNQRAYLRRPLPVCKQVAPK